MPKCTINGKPVEVKEGTSIIQAMMQSGDRIAHYCWHPGLSVAGVCRLCMIEIEGNPRVQIACNTMVTEGMKINNTSEKVKEAVKWGLDFHLINHPLDCPICDQAGECGLQEQYMEYGKYDPEMSEPKQKKRKVVDLGSTVVLDSERCILCSRCVRFTDEISQTHELGIFNRGDRSEVGTHDGKKLENKYSLNTVDICPVGALTSKDFRFRQRVWYLKDAQTLCTGCSTGCSTKVYFNKEGFHRVKPVNNPDVNGYWMCDEGRNIYKFLNKDHRLTKAKHSSSKSQNITQEFGTSYAVSEIQSQLQMQLQKNSASSLALVLTGQYSTEELDAIVTIFKKQYQSQQIFHWINNPESFDSFDGLLIRGDKNPNTKGLLKVLEKHGIKNEWKELVAGISEGKIKSVVVAGPEIQNVYPDMPDKMKLFSKVDLLIWLGAGKNSALDEMIPQGSIWQIPTQTYVEKSGTFTNFQGKDQKFSKITTIIPEAISLSDFATLLSGKSIQGMLFQEEILVDRERPVDLVMKEHIKKNEFVFRKGSL